MSAVLVSTVWWRQQRKGSSPRVMESGTVRFGNWEWRINPGKKNKMDHFHFWPRSSNRDSCQELGNRQQRAGGTSEVSPPNPHLLPERVSRWRCVGEGRTQVDILGWVNGANSPRRRSCLRLESVLWTQSNILRDCGDLRDLSSYILSINKSVKW